MYEWHLEMAARLELNGKFEEASVHLARAKLLEPALKQLMSTASANTAQTQLRRLLSRRSL
jgi:hypothetical protein